MEVSVKSHLIITDIHNEYNINWCGKLQGANPVMENDKPVFIIQSSNHYIEMNTWDMKSLENTCKKITCPRGKEAVTSDQAFIYLKEKDNKRRLMCIVKHQKVKTFAPMYDKVGWRDE